MSETAGSVSTTSATSATSSTANVTPGNNSSGNSDASKAQSQTTGQNQSATGTKKEIIPTHGAKESQKTNETKASEADDHEEIAIGSVKSRVPKAMAQAIKNLERGFHSKAQESAQKEKLLKLATENPKEYFKQTGKDPYALAEELLAERFEEMTLSPEQKAQKEKDARLKQYEAQEKQSKQEYIDQLKQLGEELPKGAEGATKEELAQYVAYRKHEYQKQAQSLDHEIGQAFSESGLPADDHTLAKVAWEISKAAKQGKDLSAKDALAKVTKGADEGLRQRLSKMDGQRIHELLGEQVIDLIRKHDLERVNAQASSQFGQNPQNGQGSNSSSQNGPKKYVNQSEWRKLMGIG